MAFNYNKMTAEEKQTLIEHLEDLRKSLIISAVAVFVAASGAFFYSNQIIDILQAPIVSLGLKLNYIDVTEPFFVQLKVALAAGFIIAFPVVAWAIWRFIAPALYPKEKRYILTLFPIIVLLFVAGVLFSYFTILKLILMFFIQTAPSLNATITIDNYVSFLTAFTLPFGVVFELPVVVYFLTMIGWIKSEWLVNNRKYALLIIFILAAILTPGGNPIPQIVMALPVYLLYEISILVSKLTERGMRKRRGREDSENGD